MYSCHLDAGHYNPNYNHSKMVGIPGQNTSGATSIDTSLFFKEPTTVTSFTDYVEQITRNNGLIQDDCHSRRFIQNG